MKEEWGTNQPSLGYQSRYTKPVKSLMSGGGQALALIYYRADEVTKTV
jgi:hypothetical protein